MKAIVNNVICPKGHEYDDVYWGKNNCPVCAGNCKPSKTEAEHAAYIQALDDVYKAILQQVSPDSETPLLDVLLVLIKLKSDYQKGKTE